jgi:dihydrolipoamide dehydrogenase
VSNRTKSVDVAILGAGSAGLSAWRAARKLGVSVALIDPGPFGTTCARVGCMPSKLLIAPAEAAHHARHASDFGVHSEGVRVDGREVMERVQSERDRFVGFVMEVIEEAREAGELVIGRGRVTGPGQMEVDDGTTLHFERLVIATGSAPIVPPPFRGIQHALLTNETIFELEKLPASVLVVGLGAIGLELGQALHRLDVRTTMVGIGGQVGPLSDPVILEDARETLAQELDIHTSYELETIAPEGDGVRIRFVDSKGRKRDETFDKVLMAAGRKPNLTALGLDTLGLEPDGRGRYDVDPETLQLGDTPIFVAGDVNELHPVLHEAADDGRIAGGNAAQYPEVRTAWRRTPLGIVFSDPQIGVVGGGYAALSDCEAVAGKVSFRNQGRARVQAMNAGTVRIYADKHTGRLIGAELFGPRVEHLSHLLAWAVQSKLTVRQALDMPFYHPVVEEGVRTALRDLDANLRHGEPIKCRVTEMGVGC